MITLIRQLSSNRWKDICRDLARLLDGWLIRASLCGMATSKYKASARRAALYVRVSTSDKGQTVENQLQPLREAATRLGWSIVAVYCDEGISGARGRAR